MTRFGSALVSWLAHPLAKTGAPLDDPAAVDVRRSIIASNGFLQDIYSDWYRALAARLPPPGAPALEIGSATGFMTRHIPQLITSDALRCAGIQVVLDAVSLPFSDGSLRAIVMTNVLHHVSDVERFLKEAARCVREGGVLAMIEPWVTTWSRVVYRYLHHESFEPEAAWRLGRGGPLSGANGALPWIVFQRDRERFSQRFPEWRLDVVQPQMPLRYLVSGGVSLRPLMPRAATPLFRVIERTASPGAHRLGMFALISLTRTAP